MFDPTECLITIMLLANRVGRHPELKEEVALLTTKLAEMNVWLRQGGELPDQWKR